MAHALIFGPARTDGLAILMREYVTRNRFLPAFIFIDRGSENTSRWFREFCEEAGISWMYSPTGGSRYNGLAENVVGRVNSQVAHKLVGSTKPDQIGRAVDGKFKSRKNSRIRFSVIAKEFENFIYNDLADNPNDDNISPRELSFEMLAFGEFCGRPACLDASLLIMTAVPTGTTPRIERGYIRTSTGKYSSIEFQGACANIKSVDELRRDCVNPSVMYARIGASWHQVFNRAVHLYSQVTDLEKLWMLLMQPINAAHARERKTEQKAERFKRHTAINDAASAHESIAPPLNLASSAGPREDVVEPLDWEALDGFV
jgi:putative transposase